MAFRAPGREDVAPGAQDRIGDLLIIVHSFGRRPVASLGEPQCGAPVLVRLLRGDGLKPGRNCKYIVFVCVVELIGHRGHRSGRNAMLLTPAVEQVIGIVVQRPGNRGDGMVAKRRCQPALCLAPFEQAVDNHCAEAVARRVAGPAVAERHRKVGAAVQFLVKCRVGYVGRSIQKQQLPPSQNWPEGKRERQLVRRPCGNDRRLAHKPGIDRAQVLVRRLGETVVGEGRVKMPAFAVKPFPHRPGKGGEAPSANAGFRIGGDVGRIDRAEGRRKSKPSRQRSATLGRMAGRTGADQRQ